MWKSRNKPKTVIVTKKVAEEWNALEEIREDRPLSERRLQVYRKVLAAGEFRPVTWAKVYVKEMDQYYRVNGKHTSTVFSTTDLSKCQEVIAVIEDYEADTIEDAAKLYATFDSNIQVRNQGDINRMFAATIPELKDMSSHDVNLYVASINYFRSPGPNATADRGLTAADKAEVLFEEIEFIQWCHALIGSGDGNTGKSQHMRRAPVVAAMRGCYGKNQKAALEFWTLVRDESAPKNSTPDRKLAKWLTIMRVRVGAKSNTPTRYRVFAREFYVKCIHAWNAWRKNETTNLQYYQAAKIPSFS